MSNVVQLSEVRLSFPVLIEPESYEEDGEKKYRADLIMSPDHHDYAVFMKAVYEVALAKWNAKAQPILTMINNDRKLRCYGNGNERLDSKTFQPYIGYENMMYVTGTSSNQIEMFDAQGNAVPEGNSMLYKATARKMYGGCYVNAAVQLWCQDNNIGRGIRCSLLALQFAKDGEAFGEARPDVSGMFRPVAGAAPAGVPQPPIPDWMK